MTNCTLRRWCCRWFHNPYACLDNPRNPEEKDMGNAMEGESIINPDRTRRDFLKTGGSLLLAWPSRAFLAVNPDNVSIRFGITLNHDVARRYVRRRALL